jgi:hypothetical protein
LDLYLWSCHEALAFGRKEVQVNVLRLGWNPSASTPSLIDRIFRRQARRAVVPAAEEHVPPAAVAPEPDAETTTTEPDSSEPLTDPATPVAPSVPDPIASGR